MNKIRLYQAALVLLTFASCSTERYTQFTKIKVKKDLVLAENRKLDVKEKEVVANNEPPILLKKDKIVKKGNNKTQSNGNTLHGSKASVKLNLKTQFLFIAKRQMF